jgi:mono/diheme cytochrome c family protein
MSDSWKSFIALPFALVLSVVLLDLGPAAEPDAGKQTKPAEQAKPVDYATQIKPLLTKHCVGCHGVKKQESGLRVDAGSLAKQGGDRGDGIVPGKAEKSHLYLSLLGQGDITAMPYEKPKLKPAEIALFKRWIDEGAKVPAGEIVQRAEVETDHWAFQPIKRPRLPDVKDATWSRRGFDRLVLARLEKEGVSPAPQADAVTLIRRVSFDLRGLPPSPDEVAEFLADSSPDRYERFADRMLASPHYGERWGRHWLDLARYGDSNGFTIDSARSIWLYRDWVINAVNGNLPFDEFTIEQLAGDLLPDPTQQQMIATGFHRNTLINQEGGTDQEQFRVEAIVDRVNTTGSVYLGLTVGCAQCHSHKYDPVSQREYYQLFSIFNNCDEPTVRVGTPEQKKRVTDAQKLAKAAVAALAKHNAELTKSQPEWEKQFSVTTPATWTPPASAEARSQGKATIENLKDGSFVVGRPIPDHDTYTITLDVPGETITALRLETLTHNSLPMKGPGLASNGNFILSEFSVAVTSLKESDGKPKPVKIASATADHSQSGHDIARAIDGDLVNGWAINVTSGNMNVDRTATFVFYQPLKLSDGAKLKVTIVNGAKRYAIGRFRLSTTSAPAAQLTLPAGIDKVLAINADKRTKKQKDALTAFHRTTDPAHRRMQTEVDSLQKQVTAATKGMPSTLILKERTTPRETHIHVRGNFLDKGAVVAPDVPAVFPPMPKSVKTANRLDFANWLVDPSNPLTARVTVNRYWQRFFGFGIVITENDFGSQGDKPTHPELLDWLADEFMRLNWDVKALHRVIVTSATYRQASHMRPELAKRDPSNRLLARQRRVRLEAEIVRDASLAASGLLTAKLGGPSVYPPQPGGLDKFTQNPKNWKANTNENRYRRGLYTFFWRSSPDPFLMTFDAPDGNSSCTRRVRSNTPLQALTMSNDLTFVEIAQGLAGRILTKETADVAARLEHAFQLCLSRLPTDREQAVLANYYEAQLTAFKKNTADAEKFAMKDRPKNVSAAEAAAWTAVSRLLLNLDEFITRE